MQGSKLDSVFTNFAIPFENSEFRPFTDDRDNDVKLVGGGLFGTGDSANGYVTPGGSLSRRPPFTNGGIFGTGAQSVISGKRIDYVWIYETLPSTAGVVYQYLLLTVFNLTTSLWEMYYESITTGGNLTLFTNTRNCNDSTAPHKVVFSRGLAYIKGFPGSGDKLGTIIFDGSNGSVAYRLWGLLGPTTPARITGVTNKLNGALTDTATTVTVDSTTGFSGTGTIQIDTEEITYGGTTATTFTGCTRAANGTTAAAHDDDSRVLQRDWSASAHKVDVNLGWQYTYTYKSIQGHESNSADIEYNPDLLPSNTLPFFDKRPKITVQGHADTTNIPKICIYRTADGGGSFLFLEEITNTGAGSITYEDKNLGSGASGATKEDPIPDIKLDKDRIAPSLTSNSPPPTVNPPLVVGTDTPSINVTKIVSFAQRLWMAIDNVLYRSGEEQITTGIPEEAWPSGTFGAFDKYSDRIISLEATNSALYVLGTRFIRILTGSNEETFSTRVICSHAGMDPSNPNASVSFLDRVAYMTNDARVMVINGEYVDLISEPITAMVRQNSAVQFHFYASGNLQWLVCMDAKRLAGLYSTTYIYDWSRSSSERRDFWFPPWQGALSALFTGSISTIIPLCGSAYDPAGATKSSGLVTADFAQQAGTFVDSIRNNGSWDTSGFALRVFVRTFKNPAGNHINSAAVPHTTTTLAKIKLDYFTGSDTAYLTGFYDNSNLSNGTILDSMRLATVSRRPASVGYSSNEWEPYRVCDDFGLSINQGLLAIPPAVVTAPTTYMRLDRLAISFAPGAGPDTSGEQDG